MAFTETTALPEAGPAQPLPSIVAGRVYTVVDAGETGIVTEVALVVNGPLLTPPAR